MTSNITLFSQYATLIQTDKASGKEATSGNNLFLWEFKMKLKLMFKYLKSDELKLWSENFFG